MFITETDLHDFVPDVYTHGLNSFTKEIAFAEGDVVNLIKSGWWIEAVSKSFFVSELQDFGGFGFYPLDVTKLNSEALKKITVYRAVSGYIYPKLATFKDVDGDSFSRKAEFYKGMYKEEWEVIRKLPLYDFNSDGTFSDLERRVSSGRTLGRA